MVVSDCGAGDFWKCLPGSSSQSIVTSSEASAIENNLDFIQGKVDAEPGKYYNEHEMSVECLAFKLIRLALFQWLLVKFSSLFVMASPTCGTEAVCFHPCILSSIQANFIYTTHVSQERKTCITGTYVPNFQG